MLPNVGSYAFTCCAANTSADLLDDDHKGIGEQQRPRDCESKLCSRLGVRSDAAWVIICGARNKTWPKRTKNAVAPQAR